MRGKPWGMPSSSICIIKCRSPLVAAAAGKITGVEPVDSKGGCCPPARRSIMSEGDVGKRTQYIIEGLFSLRKAKWSG